MVEREAALARFEPAQRRHVDARPAGDVLQRQPALHAQFPQPPPDPQIDVVLGGVFACMANQFGIGRRVACKLVAWTRLMPRSTGSSTTASVTGSGAVGSTSVSRRWRRHWRRAGRWIWAAGRAPMRVACRAGLERRRGRHLGYRVAARGCGRGVSRRRVTGSSSSSTTCPIAFRTAPSTLISAQFLHSMIPFDRPRILKRAAGAVRPGGLLLIVDHGRAAAVGVEAGPPPRIPQCRRGRRRTGTRRRMGPGPCGGR